MGLVISGAIEKSNVSIIAETIDITDLERSMNAALTAIRMASQMIDRVIETVGN